MNDTTQTIIRSVLKVGGGFLIAKGIADESQVEAIIAGVTVVIGIVWGILHKKPAA